MPMTARERQKIVEGTVYGFIVSALIGGVVWGLYVASIAILRSGIQHLPGKAWSVYAWDNLQYLVWAAAVLSTIVCICWGINKWVNAGEGETRIWWE